MRFAPRSIAYVPRGESDDHPVHRSGRDNRRFVGLSLLAKATAILVVGLAVVAAARQSRAAVRHLLLASTFAALLALPPVAAAVPTVVIEVPGAGGVAVERGAPERQDAATRHRGDGAPASSTPLPAWTASTWPLVLRTVWAAGTTLLLLSLGIAAWRLGRVGRSGVPWLEARGLVRSVGAEAGIRRSVETVLHEAVVAPVTFGLRRPTIVFPSAARHWSDADVRQALLHELEHVRRADWPIQLLARVACAVFWFHPLSWIAWRRLCLEAERACDDAVVQHADRTAYAEQLVLLARRLRNAPSQPALAMVNRSDLATRVSAILDAAQRRGPAGVRSVVATTAGAALIVVAMAPVRAIEVVATTDSAERQRSGSADRALFRAAERGNVDRVTALLAAGANVNAAIDGDGSPLIAAARAGREEIVRLLLDRGADPNMPVPGDGSPLIVAAAEGHLSIVELLLDRGAQIDRVVEDDENALIQAAGLRRTLHGEIRELREMRR